MNIIELAKILSNGFYKTAKHLEYIEQQLIELSNRKIKRLMINMPPRHGKSELISKYFPFWYLTKFKHHNIIHSTYGESFSISTGKRLKELMLEFSKKYIGIDLAKDSRSAKDLRLQKAGSIYLAGAGGSLTGRGCDLLIIDDPVKSNIQAYSQRMQENLLDWYCSTAFTRLEPDGVVVILMTRWHENDLCGRLLEQEREKWTVISLPAIAEQDDLLGREVGEALWAERYGLDHLNDIKSTMNSIWFSSMYQQRPAPAEGVVFKRKYFQYFIEEGDSYFLPNNTENRVDKNLLFYNATVDLATSEKSHADYTVCLVFAYTEQGNILVIDVIRTKMSGASHLEFFQEVYRHYNLFTLGIEKVGTQSISFDLAAKTTMLVKELNPIGDKYLRTFPIATKLEQGKVYFKKFATWLAEFEKELITYPNGKHDDQVDAFAYITHIISQISQQLPLGRTKKGKD